MILDILNLAATSVLAFAALQISKYGNGLTQNANDIAARAAKLERDKNLIEWAQRVLSCMSLMVSLRQQNEAEADSFSDEVRRLRADLYALYREGQIFFRSEPGPASPEQAGLSAIRSVADLSSGKNFKPPSKGDHETLRRPQYLEILKQTDIFLKDIQSRVGDHWME